MKILKVLQQHAMMKSYNITTSARTIHSTQKIKTKAFVGHTCTTTDSDKQQQESEHKMNVEEVVEEVQYVMDVVSEELANNTENIAYDVESAWTTVYNISGAAINILTENKMKFYAVHRKENPRDEISSTIGKPIVSIDILQPPVHEETIFPELRVDFSQIL